MRDRGWLEQTGAKYRDLEATRGELGQREALHRLWLYLQPLRVPLILGILFTFLWSAVNLGYGALVKVFVEAVQTCSVTHNSGPLTFYTAIGLVAMAARSALSYGLGYCFQDAGQRLAMRLRNEVFAHLQDLPTSFFDHRKTGQLMSCLSNDIPAVNSVLFAVQDSIHAPVMLVGGITLLFWLSWPLALLSLVCLPPTAAVILKATRRMRVLTGRLQENLSGITEHAEETISGIRVVKAFGNEGHEIERFNSRSQNVFRSVMRTIRVRLLTSSSVEFLGAFAIIAVLYTGGLQVIFHPQQFSLPKLTFFVLVLKQVADASRNAGQISVNLGAAGMAADRVFTLLDLQTDIQEKPEAIELRRIRGRVEFDDVGFAYSPGIPVLADLSFAMEPGEVVAVVGPTGSGKTTIAALVPRLYDVSGGRITVDGVDVRDCTLKSLRAHIGVVPQETLLFAGTLRENIAYGRLDAAEEDIVRAARLANACEFIDRLPEGLDTLVGERGTRLSGGQRQRIAIARAVLRDPRILILDEATSSLDTQSEALVQDALQKVTADRTTLVIAHRLSTVRNAHKILVLKEGRIVEAGCHEELLSRGGDYSDLYRTQFRWDEGPGEDSRRG